MRARPLKRCRFREQPLCSRFKPSSQPFKPQTSNHPTTLLACCRHKLRSVWVQIQTRFAILVLLLDMEIRVHVRTCWHCSSARAQLLHVPMTASKSSSSGRPARKTTLLQCFYCRNRMESNYIIYPCGWWDPCPHFCECGWWDMCGNKILENTIASV